MTDVLLTRFTIESVQYTYTCFVAKKNTSYCISPKSSFNLSKLPTNLLFYNLILPYELFSNKANANFNITSENSLYTVDLLTIKFETFRVGSPTKWQNSNVNINNNALVVPI